MFCTFYFDNLLQTSGVGSNFSMGGLQLGKEDTARNRQAISTNMPRNMGGLPAPGAPLPPSYATANTIIIALYIHDDNIIITNAMGSKFY